jgi:hypothetical protein
VKGCLETAQEEKALQPLKVGRYTCDELRNILTDAFPREHSPPPAYMEILRQDQPQVSRPLYVGIDRKAR